MKIFFVGLFIVEQTIIESPVIKMAGSIVMGIGAVMILLDK